MVKTVRRQWSIYLFIIGMLSLVPGLAGFTYVPSVHAASVKVSRHHQNADNVYWPQSQALPRFATPQHLDVVDLQPATGDMRLMISTLQGIVNRQRPSIYLVEHARDEGPYTWLNEAHLAYQVHKDPWEVVKKYAQATKGVIIYDPNLLDTINVATTEAGIANGIVASPTLAQKLTAAPYNLPVLDDLRGKFNNALDAYNWEFQNLWPKTTHRMLVGISPTTSETITSSDNGGASYGGIPYGCLRDYAVANRAFVFWLTADENVDSDQVSLFNQILSSVQPGTPYLGWFDKERPGVRLASRHGVYVLAADWFSNLTVWSGVRASSQPIKTIAAPALRNKVYVTFVVSDGDNLQYSEHYMRTLWDDPSRGKVPLNWSINPLLIDAAPFLLNHYQTTAGNDDLLVSAPSGAGYFYPSLWPQDNLSTYLQQSNSYLRRMGTNIVYAIDKNAELPEYVAQAYAQTNLQGMFLNTTDYHSTLTTASGNLPISTQLHASTDTGIVQAIHQQAAQWDRQSPLFITVSLIAWKTTPADAVYVAQHLNSHYKVVRGDQFFQLIHEANAAPVSAGRLSPRRAK